MLALTAFGDPEFIVEGAKNTVQLVTQHFIQPAGAALEGGHLVDGIAVDDDLVGELLGQAAQPPVRGSGQAI